MSLFAFAVTIFALPTVAQDWSRYVNPRFGVGANIPAGYTATGPSERGDGKLFRAANGRSSIQVWGNSAAANIFADEMRARIAADEAEGWTITYRSETPDWAAWSGSRAGHVFFARSISTCNGRQTANVRLAYPAADLAAFDPIARTLGASLAQDGACF